MAANTPAWKDSSAFAGILKEQETFGNGKGEDAADQINNWFDDLMLQSGLMISPSMILARSALERSSRDGGGKSSGAVDRGGVC